MDERAARMVLMSPLKRRLLLKLLALRAWIGERPVAHMPAGYADVGLGDGGGDA